MEVCVVDIHFIALGHYMPPHTAHTALLKPQQANGIYVSMPQKLRGRLPNLSSYNIAGPCAGDLGCYRVVQLEHDALSVARGLRASDSHDKTRSVAEYEAIDAVLQVALCEVILAQPTCIVEAQSCQRVRQQGTRVLVHDLQQHCLSLQPTPEATQISCTHLVLDAELLLEHRHVPQGLTRASQGHGDNRMRGTK